MPRVTHTCPTCGSVHTEVKEYYTRTIKLGTEVNARCNNCKKVGKYLQMSKAVIATMMYKPKVLKRNSYGVRHFGRFRARLLMILSSIYNKPDIPVSVAV